MKKYLAGLILLAVGSCTASGPVYANDYNISQLLNDVNRLSYTYQSAQTQSATRNERSRRQTEQSIIRMEQHSMNKQTHQAKMDLEAVRLQERIIRLQMARANHAN